jgi:hypothetical protein
MGQRLLGQLPATRNWTKVIALLKDTDSINRIANATSQAANRGLELAKRDKGVASVAFALMKVIWASQKEEFFDELADLNISVSAQASLLDAVGAFDDALDRSLREAGHRSDLAEMARFSAVDAMSNICRSETGNLFGPTAEDLRNALKKYATPQQFGSVGQNFFGWFLYRFLDYHLSRELANHIGPGKQFASTTICQEFKDGLALHCYQTARIVKEFSGCWPSATEYREGISLENVRTKFLPVAFKKIQGELRKRVGSHA